MLKIVIVGEEVENKMTFDPTGKERMKMTESETIYRYIHAGKGEVTLVSPQSLKAHSYSFEQPTNPAQFPENTIFVYVLHNGHKMYLGMLDGSGFKMTRGSSFGEDTESVKGARYIVKMANRQDVVDKDLMHLYHSGKCCMCGRTLESDKAMKRGIGRCCLKKFNIALGATPWDGN